MDFAFLVVPIESNAEVASSLPVFLNLVVLFKCLDKMVDVGFVDVFNSEIIHNQCETDGSPVVFPVSWCDLAYAVLDDDTGDLLEYRHLIKHPKYKDTWSNSFRMEIRRLATTTETISFISKTDIPKIAKETKRTDE